MTRSRRSALRAAVLLSGWMVIGFSSHAQQLATKRLSGWLTERVPAGNDYPAGLSWRVPGEVPFQNSAYVELIDRLSGFDRELKADAAAVNRLREWLRGLPVTGRVPVPSFDARWLEANPARDPILSPGHVVVVPRRPTTVTVVTDRGERCAVAHTPGAEAKNYLDACDPAPGGADWAWVAQPDGQVRRFGIASWNRVAQDEPAPGAWIWAPARNSGWPESISERLITFLATQGPAPDPDGGGNKAVVTPSPRSRGSAATANDWGGTGLMQTPTARMAQPGYLGTTITRVYPYTYFNFFAQPFDWLEAGFRYTSVSNRLYGPAIAGDQSYKDKSMDFKLRLFEETGVSPEVAVGIRDVLGTGMFSGEYFVGSKRTGAFDWSLGLGWGYVGGRGNMRNPFGVFGDSFNTRKAYSGEGGNVNFGAYFHGRTSLFGGVQYQTPWDALLLKLEYDGNDYQHEPIANNQRQSSPWNLGMVYRMGRAADLSLGVERGNTAMLGLTLHTQLDRLSMPKLDDPRGVPVAALRSESYPEQSREYSIVARELETQTGWRVGRIERAARELRVVFNDAEATYWRARVDRAVAVLHRDAPVSVDRFVLVYRRYGNPVAEHVIDRDTWVASHTRFLPPHARREAVAGRETVLATAPAPGESFVYEKSSPRFDSGLGLGYQQTLGGPDGFILFQLSAVEQVKWRLREDTWLQGSLQLALIDNYDKFKYDAPSNLPRVRTYMREYLTTSRTTLPNLELAHMGRMTENQYYVLYGGYLESMFAGVGGEWLYRSYGSRTAVGIDLNRVKQRAFRQDFGFLDPAYSVTTGHATLYWDTGWSGVQANLSAGRYLAGDSGATVDLSRVFGNGVRIGGYFTRTNATTVQFGEGSFDKGLYVVVPFDALLTRSSSSVGNFLWKPLTRDGGAKLERGVSLYDLTAVRDGRALLYQPARPSNN